jgi:hypothetical protein
MVPMHEATSRRDQYQVTGIGLEDERPAGEYGEPGRD